LFAEFNKLHNSITTNFFTSGQIIEAESMLHNSLMMEDPPDIEAAKRVIEDVTRDMQLIREDVLTRDEFHKLAGVKMSFIRIGRVLMTDRPLAELELRQIHTELLKIGESIKEFRGSFRPRMEREAASKGKVVTSIYLLTGLGLFLLFAGLYRYFIGPILYLGSQVAAVRDGKTENITVYKRRDEIGSLSEFTHQTLKELYKSNEALSRRLELQHAMSEVLKVAQQSKDIDVFLKEALDIILSLRWLNVMNKGGIYLVDETDPERFLLKAEKNYLEQQKKACSRFLIGECICGMAAKRGEVIYKASVDADHVITYEDMQPHGHYCVPIKHEDRVLGVINLYLAEGYAKNELDIDFLRNISMIISDVLVLKKLSEREHLITMAIEESGESVIIADRGGYIEYVNPAYERITGFSKEDVMRESLLTNIKCGLGEDVCSIVKSGSLWSGTFKGKRMDGRDYFEYLSVLPVKDEKGEVAKYVYIGRDITRERSLEEQLIQSQKMEVIGKFAGGIAHDFNNILTAIKGYGEFLMDEMKEGDPLRSYVEEIRLSTDRAANLTKSLLTFSRRQPMALRPVNLNEVIRGVEKLLLRLIGEDIQLRTLLTPPGFSSGIITPPSPGSVRPTVGSYLKRGWPKAGGVISEGEGELAIMADAGQMEQVLMNLATNARDAMPEGGTLTIETGVVTIDEEYVRDHIFAKSGSHAVLSVSDTGAGMDEETRQKIFEPFFTTKGVGKGTGLGLSIVYGIIKQHDGNINVYSEPGIGTTFKIFLPLIKAAVEEIKPVETLTPGRGTETVLLAEDDTAVRKLIKEALLKYGYSVMEAEDGEEAVRFFAENKDKIDILLFDIMMPKMKGTEAYEEILKIRPEIKVLFMSGYTEEVIYREGVLDKGLSFISKPVSPHEILIKIRKVLDK